MSMTVNIHHLSRVEACTAGDTTDWLHIELAIEPGGRYGGFAALFIDNVEQCDMLIEALHEIRASVIARPTTTDERTTS